MIEYQVAERGGADQLNISEWRDDRRSAALKCANYQQMPEAAQKSETAKQQPVPGCSRHDKHEWHRQSHSKRCVHLNTTVPVHNSILA
jgi:hypothetical protein